jgi:hypothetical protein
MNKRMLSAIVVLPLLAVFIFGCDKKIAKAVPKEIPPPPAGFCDTINYAQDIQPILTANCVSCHQSGNPKGDYTNYAGTKAKVDDASFKVRVLDSPTNPMPASGQLPQEQLRLIKCWLDRGAPVN